MPVGGNYGFLLTVVDGQHSGGGGIDLLRLKVWDKNAGNAVVYDNRLGSPDDIDIATRARSTREASSFTEKTEVAQGGIFRPAHFYLSAEMSPS